MKYLPTTNALVEVVLPAIPTSVGEARAAVSDAVAGIGVEQRLVDDIRLCISEAVANSVRHAYRAEPGTVQVVVTRLGDELIAVVCDEGEGFERSSRLQFGETGGLGLEIIETLTNRHAISTAPNAGTEVRMIFALRATSPGDARPSRA